MSCSTVTLDLRQSLRSRQLVVRFDGGRPVVGLRAPLDLVDLSTVSQPRWPVEREVIGAVIEHIGPFILSSSLWNAVGRLYNKRCAFAEWDPPDPEPFYRPTGLEVRPEAAGGQGQLVFCSDLGKCSKAAELSV